VGQVYRCGSDQRRQGILAPPSGAVLNGIDYLEVIDEVPVATMPRQRTLLVHLFRDAPTSFSPANVRLTGGVRVTGVAASWIQRADAVVAPGVSPAEAAHYAALADATRVLVIRTDVEGDFADYHLALVAGGGSAAAPPGFDPVLAGVDFGFKVECPTDFDCAGGASCPTPPGIDPAIDYLAKDYASFRRVLLDRLAVTAPAWRDRSPADPMMTVIELLAYAGDHLSYHQDAVATEAYLDTARRRVSVRRHARLLDYQVHEGACARAWVTVTVDTDLAVAPGDLRFLATRGDAPILAAAELAEQAAQPLTYELLHPASLRIVNNRIRFYTWGETDCCLPRGATRATLLGQPVVAAGDVLIFEEELGPPTWTAADADPTHRHAVRLTAVTARVDPFNDQQVVDVAWDTDDALPFPLCLSARRPDQSAVPEVSAARGNVVLVEHGARVAVEALPNPVAGARRHRPRLRHRDLAHAVPYDHAAAVTRAAGSALRIDPRDAFPVIELHGPDGRWQPQRDLLGSSPTANDFVVEVDDDGAASLRFGDGRLGRRAIADLTAHYRVGRGAIGNVGRDTLRRAVLAGTATGATPITAVRNPLPAGGGADPEPVREVKLYAPQAFRTNRRAVSEADYAARAETYRDVQRAVAVRRWSGSWNTMVVVVDRKGGRTLDADPEFRDGLVAHLDDFRLAGFDLQLADPVFVSLDLHLVICVKPGFFRADVRRSLLDVFTAGERRDGGGPGFFHPDHFTFAQPVHLSQVVAAAMAVPGVEWVDTRDPRVRFQRFGRAAAGELASQVIAMGTTEIARLESSPSLPEHGRLGFDLDGGR
jgi:hypothetical protein